MKWVFWASVALLAYTYMGYAGWLWLRVRIRPRPLHLSPYRPSVSIVMVVRNEAAVLDRKLRNLLALYPADLCEIVVVSDGSTDDTNQILNYYAAENPVRIILKQESSGKAAGLN
ncbi:MAG TPA: glycosyltransferase, partial [Terriglobales bacterium]